MKPIGMHNYFVYILTNVNKTTLYVGVTNDIRERIHAHKQNRSGFAYRYRCFYLLYFEHFQYINDAIDREKQIKKWRREKKEALINSKNPDWDFIDPMDAD